MRSQTVALNPFLMMLEPEQVLNAMAQSDELRRLQHRECRPLDRPVLRALSRDLVAFDAEIDQAMEMAEGEEVSEPSLH